MKRRMWTLALTLCLILTACGGSEEEQPDRSPSLLGGAAGLEEEAVLLTVDGREVPAWRYLYWLARTCDAIQEEYKTAGAELDWDAQTGVGSLAEYAKAQALSDTALYATVENWAQLYHCTLSEEEGAERAVPELGLDEARAKDLADVGRQYGELYTLFCTEGSALAPTQETLSAFADEQGWMGADRILVPYGEDREAAQQRAAELFSQLNAAEDQAAEFTRLAAAASDTAGARTLCLGDGTFSTELEEALAALEEGQCSGILESEEGYSILHRLPADADALMEDCFDYLLKNAAEQAEVQCTQDYVSLDAAVFYEALQRLRSED